MFYMRGIQIGLLTYTPAWLLIIVRVHIIQILTGAEFNTENYSMIEADSHFIFVTSRKTAQICQLSNSLFLLKCGMQYIDNDPACISRHAQTVSKHTADNTVLFSLRNMLWHFRGCLFR